MSNSEPTSRFSRDHHPQEVTISDAPIGWQRRLAPVIIFGGIAIVAVLVLIVVTRANLRNTGSSLRLGQGRAAHGQVVDGLSCEPLRTLSNGSEAALEIYVNGRAQPVPAGIGMVLPPGPSSQAQASNGLEQCAYPLRTEGTDGIVQMDTAASGPFTLGQFFDLWGQPLSRTQVAGYRADTSHPLTFVVLDAQGRKTTSTGDPRKIPLLPHTTVAVLYSSPGVTPHPQHGWSTSTTKPPVTEQPSATRLLRPTVSRGALSPIVLRPSRADALRSVTEDVRQGPSPTPNKD